MILRKHEDGKNSCVADRVKRKEINKTKIVKFNQQLNFEDHTCQIIFTRINLINKIMKRPIL